MASRVRHCSLHRDETKRQQKVPGHERQNASLPQPRRLSQGFFKPKQHSRQKSH